ncbi:peptidase C65 Otubain-domain-containing protein, partial [Colletotrichum lupini]
SNHNLLHGHLQQQQHPPPPHPHPGASSSTTSSSSAFYTTNSNANPGFTNTAAALAPDHAHAPAHAVSTTRRPCAMEPGDPSDVAAQEAAARDYQPQLEGLLVGDKITSDAITDEYAKADEIYIAKTITYSHYRPVQGDGNCGWRAIGFSYFEHLINNGDQHQILGEAARITSLNQYLLNVGGYDRMLFEDMVEETIGLLKDVAQNIANPQLAMDIMVQRFNDQGSSNAIIYHLRLLALSWLKGNVELYEPFIPAETGIIGYCAEIERPNREIDHLGIILLVQVLLKPINFVLEIAYLDRSPGNQVNIYRFPDEANGQDPATLGPIIYLLYRPDHYDILYKSPPNPPPLNLQVHRVGSFSHSQEIASVGPPLHSYSLDYGPLAMLPGFGGPPSGLSSALSSLGSPTSTSPLPDAYDPSPQSPWLATPYSGHQIQQQQQQQQTAPAPRPQPQTPARPQQSTPAPTKPSQPVDYQLRFSHQCWHLNNTSSAQPSVIPGQAGFHEPSFTTAMFKNSHFNKAHYNNPHFHPEEWTPDDDGHHERLPAPKKKGRVRSDH